MSGEVEDERHFVLDCVVYEDVRKKMFEMVKKYEMKKNEIMEDVMKSESGRQRIFNALIGEGVEGDEIEYCRHAMKRRNGIVVTELDQRT